MPQFFFHFQQHGVLIQDDIGTDLPSAEEAYLEAFRAARELWAEMLLDREDPITCCFDVQDAQGQPLFVLPFVEVLEVCQPPTRNYEHQRYAAAPFTLE